MYSEIEHEKAELKSKVTKLLSLIKQLLRSLRSYHMIFISWWSRSVPARELARLLRFSLFFSDMNLMFEASCSVFVYRGKRPGGIESKRRTLRLNLLPVFKHVGRQPTGPPSHLENFKTCIYDVINSSSSSSQMACDGVKTQLGGNSPPVCFTNSIVGLDWGQRWCFPQTHTAAAVGFIFIQLCHN